MKEVVLAGDVDHEEVRHDELRAESEGGPGAVFCMQCRTAAVAEPEDDGDITPLAKFVDKHSEHGEVYFGEMINDGTAFRSWGTISPPLHS